MSIEYDPSQSAVYIHTLSSHIRIPNDFRVILVNDEIHFIKPGVDITNYAEHAILKWGSNSEDSVSTSNVTYVNADNVETDLETYLKNLRINVKDVIVQIGDETVNLSIWLSNLHLKIINNQHNLERVREALVGLLIIPTDWRSD
jgi:hypothetical protein